MTEMTLNDYQKSAMRTAGKMESKQHEILCSALGTAGEAGELANKVKKAIYHQHGIVASELMDEAGDVLWYLAMMADALDVTLQQIAEMNLRKLAKRYPEGFSTERSIDRVV